MKKNSKKILSVLTKKRYFVLIVLVVFLFLLYKSDTVMIDIPKSVAGKIEASTSLDFFYPWSKFTGALFRFEDDINLFRLKSNLLDGSYPVYSIELTPNDLRHFDALSKNSTRNGYLPPELNTWRRADLILDDQKYNIRARLHGDVPGHWSNELKSYQIRTNREIFVNNIRRFNLILFEDRFFRPFVARKLAESFNLMDVRDDLVVLRINGVLQGLYYLQEALQEEFLENNACSNCYIVSTSDNWVEDRRYDIGPYQSANTNGIFWATGHRTPFDYELGNVDIDLDGSNVSRVLFRVNQLFTAVEENDPNLIHFFDADQLSSFEAFRMLVGSPHMIAGDNLKMAYQSTNGKFYPLPSVKVFGKLKIEQGGIERSLSTFGRPVDLFYQITQNDEIRHLRNKKVYGYVSNTEIVDEYNEIVEMHEKAATSFKTNEYNSRQLKQTFEDLSEILTHNIKTVKEILEKSSFYATVIEKENSISIELIPESIAEITFDAFAIELSDEYTGEISFAFTHPSTNETKIQNMEVSGESKIDLIPFISGLYFSAGFDENLYPKAREYNFEITFEDTSEIFIESIAMDMRNDITGEMIPKSNSRIQIIETNEQT